MTMSAIDQLATKITDKLVSRGVVDDELRGLMQTHVVIQLQRSLRRVAFRVASNTTQLLSGLSSVSELAQRN